MFPLIHNIIRGLATIAETLIISLTSIDASSGKGLRLIDQELITNYYY